MNRIRSVFYIAACIGLIFLVALCWSVAPVSAGPSVQITVTPRPKITPTSIPLEVEPPTLARAPRLVGSILDWGKGNMSAGVKVILRGDGWQVPVETDPYGEYRFQDIGNEVAFLNVVIPEGRGELRPLTVDLPVRIQADRELVINMALYPNGTDPEPLVDVDVTASTLEAQPGANVSYLVTVANHWDQQINQAIVADYLPQDLVYISATSSQGEVVYDRGLVWVTLGSLAPNASATVTIIAKVSSQSSSGTKINNQVAVYHSENVAVQDAASVSVTEGTNHVLPVTGDWSMLPVVGLLLVGLLWGARRLRRARA